MVEERRLRLKPSLQRLTLPSSHKVRPISILIRLIWYKVLDLLITTDIDQMGSLAGAARQPDDNAGVHKLSSVWTETTRRGEGLKES